VVVSAVVLQRRRSLTSYDEWPDGARREKEGRALFFGAMTTWNDLRMKVWTDDSTLAANVALDVTPRQEEELQRLGSVDQAGKAKSTRPTIQP
jgi:hypothetical protein